MAIKRRSPGQHTDLEQLLAKELQKAGLRLRRLRLSEGAEPDFVADAGDQRWVVVLTVSSEARRDRLIPLLSQAILQAQAAARRAAAPVLPMAVVATNRASAALVEQVRVFGRENAPRVAIGIIDAEGLRIFNGPPAGVSEPVPVLRLRRRSVSPQRLPNLFSDLNQWMLKILLGQSLAEPFISIPRGEIHTASQLAGVAAVSVMSASRFLSRLRREGFLDEAEGPPRIVRVNDLLERWVAANRSAAEDIPACWTIKRDRDHLHASLARYVSARTAKVLPGPRARTAGVGKRRPRCCLGLYAAADALGLGIVHGVPPHLYMERLDKDALKTLGLRIAGAGDRPDVMVRVPTNRETVFRAAVMRDGLPVSDALQVWLDVSTHPSRGREQAAEVARRALGPLLGNG